MGAGAGAGVAGVVGEGESGPGGRSGGGVSCKYQVRVGFIKHLIQNRDLGFSVRIQRFGGKGMRLVMDLTGLPGRAFSLALLPGPALSRMVSRAL